LDIHLLKIDAVCLSSSKVTPVSSGRIVGLNLRKTERLKFAQQPFPTIARYLSC
jgi:hypothetical protein